MDSSFIDFMAGALVISLSGVMAPGPLTAVTVGEGSSSPHSGAMVALGHGIVEFPLMTATYFGFGFLFGLPYVKPAIGLVGGAFLIFMGIGMFRGLKGGAVAARKEDRSPLAAGIILTSGNPYFLIWWASVGASLVMRAAEFGTAGLALFMVAHWSTDLGWLWLLSALSFRGGRFFGNGFQKTVSAVSGIALLVFGGKFIFDAVRGLL